MQKNVKHKKSVKKFQKFKKMLKTQKAKNAKNTKNAKNVKNRVWTLIYHLYLISILYLKVILQSNSVWLSGVGQLSKLKNI